MKNQDYRAVISIDASPAEAFNAISSVSEWWTANTEGRSEKRDDVFTVRFGETHVTFRIREVVSNRKIVWQVTDCFLHWLKDKKEWIDTKIIFEVSEKKGTTQVSMTHVGLVPGIECYEGCAEGWNHYVKESLFRLITEGKGMPERVKAA